MIMKRNIEKDNEAKKQTFVKQESINFGYDASSYANYSSSSSTPSTVAQPLPGQPPLPPMPPPSSGVPAPSHIFGPVHSQVAPIQAWTHPHAPWQWITPQTPLQPTAREIANTFQREMPLRGNYVRRERFNHNRQVYNQRNNFRKTRRLARYGQSPGQFDQAAYFGATLTGSLGLEWQRNNYTATGNDTIINHMTVPIPNHPIPPIPPGIVTSRHSEETEDRDVKIKEVVVKKNKPRKPMSQSYPSRPWNREDAERALKTENEYNKKNKINAQSLIIKFPDPELNKDIVRLFHPGIQNIHFQSPSGPRYCFIQMAENVNIDEAIKQLEEIQFGVGNLKVERKSLRDEDNPMPEEIDPYTLYIGNLPESVNVNEVKSKFPTARVDVGYAQKMRNTRYAFIRYNSVDEAIAAYKQAHDLMWDTRSIIVRFRRQRGNACLPGEPKSNVKKVKEESSNAEQVKKEQNANHIDFKPNVKKLKDEVNQIKKDDKIKHADKSSTNQDANSVEARLQDNTNKTQNKPTLQIQEQNANSHFSVQSLITSAVTAQEQQQQPWTSQPPQIPSASEAPPPSSPTETDLVEETMMLRDIKEEPLDYEEMDMSCHMQSDNDDDNDDDDDDDVEESDDTNDDEDDNEENDNEENDNEENDNEEDDNEEDFEEDETIDDGNIIFNKSSKILEDNEDESTDHLDQMFNELENMTGDIGFLEH